MQSNWFFLFNALSIFRSHKKKSHLSTRQESRATACEASNAVLKVLTEADTSMYEIFFETSAIPELMNDFKQLKTTDAPIPWDRISGSLGKMVEISARCVAKADAVILRIAEAMKLLKTMGEKEEGRKYNDNISDRLENTREVMLAMCIKEVYEVKNAVEMLFADAREKSGYEAEVAKQILLGTSDSENAVKKLLALSRQSGLSESYVEKKYMEHRAETTRLQRLKVEAEKSKEKLLSIIKFHTETMPKVTTFTSKQETGRVLFLAVIQKGQGAIRDTMLKWFSLLSFFHNFTGLLRVSMELPRDLRAFAPLNLAAEMGAFANSLAQYYCQVSQKHFTPLANKFGSLVVLNPEEGSVGPERDELQEEAEAAQRRIEELVNRLKRKEDIETEKRMAEVERVFKENVPDLDLRMRAQIEKEFDYQLAE
jgi:hypothetical protein